LRKSGFGEITQQSRRGIPSLFSWGSNLYRALILIGFHFAARRRITTGCSAARWCRIIAASIWYTNPQRIPEFKQNAGLLSLQADYAPGKNWLAHLQIDLLRSGSETYDPLFKDHLASYRDSYENRNFEEEQFSFFAFPFYRPGARVTMYSKSEENGWGISGSLRKSQGACKTC
jgi:hypothetical protein